MPSGTPWTDEQIATMRRIAAEGGSASDAGKALGRTKGAIAGKAKREGISFGLTPDRKAMTQAATEKALVTNAERRQRTITRLYEHAERALDRLEADRFQTLVKSLGGGQEVRTLPFVPTEDARNLYGSIANMASSAARLENVGHKEANETQRSVLEDLATRLGIHDRTDAAKEAEGK